MTITIETFVEPMFTENAYVVSAPSEDGKRPGWLIDPGLGDQADQMLAYIAQEQIALEKIFLTHGHADHIAGVDAIWLGCPEVKLFIAEVERALLTDSSLNLSAPFGFDVVLQTPANGDISPGQEFSLGQSNWQILDTSGHSPGGRSLYCAEARIVFTGDALFSGSIGRTDFPGSNHGQLIRNIRQNLLTLPDETIVYSGHGPTTTIGNERKSNPFLSEAFNGY